MTMDVMDLGMTIFELAGGDERKYDPDPNRRPELKTSNNLLNIAVDSMWTLDNQITIDQLVKLLR